MNRRDILTGLAVVGGALCLPGMPAGAAASTVMHFADGRYFERVSPDDVLDPARCLLEPRWPAPRSAWQEAAACGQATFYSLMGNAGPELTLCVASGTVQIALRIPTKPAMHSNRKPAMHSNRKPATDSDPKPATVPI
jgi:hypothetical protein